MAVIKQRYIGWKNSDGPAFPNAGPSSLGFQPPIPPFICSIIPSMNELRIARAKASLESMPAEIMDKIVSIFIPASFARGDYNSPHSDFDFCVIRRDDVNTDLMTAIREFRFFEAFLDDPGTVLKDYVGLRVSDIPRTRQDVFNSAVYDGERHVWPYLWVYAFDLLAHRIHIYGPDLVADMPVVDPKTLIAHRMQNVDILSDIEKAYEAKRNDFIVPRLTTHLMKWAQLYFGEPTINKFQVLPLFMENVPDFPVKPFAIELWDEYINHRLFNYGAEENTPVIREFERRTLEFARELAAVLKTHAT